MNFYFSVVIFCLSAFLFPSKSSARWDLGLGYSSFTSGQSVPALSLLFQSERVAVEFTTTGYSTTYDYLWGKTIAAYLTQTIGVIFYQPVEFGLGLGMYQSQRGNVASGSVKASATSDKGIGPSFFVNLNLGEDMFIRMQSMVDFGHEYNAKLFFQDLSTFSIGYHW